MFFSRFSLFLLVILAATLVSATTTNTRVNAQTTSSVLPSPNIAFANTSFQNLWYYSDERVNAAPNAGRGYTWGPNSFAVVQEAYSEANGGKRYVQYFDKSRMELGSDGKSVTNGLLTKELVSGNLQVGDTSFVQLQPSTIQVAGDDNSNGANQIAPTYASFKDVMSNGPNDHRAEPESSVRQTIDHAGNVSDLPIGTGTATIQTTIAYYDSVLGHNVPKAFADYMKLQGQVWNGSNGYVQGSIFTSNPTANVFGYPVTEPYWTQAVVAGKTEQVMVQLFERRVLTYTPSNPDPFKVEMGNIGQHYYYWRYGNRPLAWMNTNENTNVQNLVGLAIDPTNNNIYSADGDSIVKFDSNNGKLLARFGSSGSGDGQFKAPTKLAVDSGGNLYVFDSGNSRIEKFDNNGNFLLKWGSAGTGNGQFSSVNTFYVGDESIGVDAQNNIYFYEPPTSVNNVNSTHSQDARIQEFSSTGQFLTSFYVSASQDYSPSSATFDHHGQAYIVFNAAHGASIGILDNKGNSVGGLSPAIASSSYAMAVDNSGNLFMGELIDSYIFGLKLDGSSLLGQALPACCVSDMAVDSTGAIYVVTNNFKSGYGVADFKTALIKLKAHL